MSHMTLRRLNGSTVGDWSSENIVHTTHYISACCISTYVYTQPRAHSYISTRSSYIRSVLVRFVCARWPWLQGSAFCTLKYRHIVLSCAAAIGPASAAASPVGSKRKTTWRNVTLPLVWRTARNCRRHRRERNGLTVVLSKPSRVVDSLRLRVRLRRQPRKPVCINTRCEM